MRRDLEIKAMEILESSLKPLPHENNELDYKADFSEKEDKFSLYLHSQINRQRIFCFYLTAFMIIADTIEANLIKPADTQNKSKKFATYIPSWA
jgi:hypothetical protein